VARPAWPRDETRLAFATDADLEIVPVSGGAHLRIPWPFARTGHGVTVIDADGRHRHVIGRS
jgi:hypothetical protein